MRLEPSDEQVMLRDTVARFLADEGGTGMGAEPLDRAAWRGLADLGLFAFLLPTAVGGLDGGCDDAMVVADVIGRALAITSLGEGIVGAADLIARHAEPAFAEQLLSAVLTGDRLIALADGPAVQRAEGVSAELSFVRWAPEADAVVVLADAEAHVVMTDAPGMTMTPTRLADGTPAAHVTLDGAAAHRIPLPPGAAAIARAMVDLVHAAEMTGAMALLCALTADYVAARRQFGVEIGSFQVVQHKRARMFILLEQARSLVIRAAAAGRDDPTFVRAANAAKAYVADAAQRVAEEAVQLHGGIGVTDELPVGRALRRVLVLGRLGGNAAAARARMAA